MADLIAPPSLGAISEADLRSFQDAFEAKPQYRAAMNAVCTTPVSQVALNRRRAVQLDHSFSVQLPENPVTNQKGSGRCWMFAALNTFRTKVAQSMNVSDSFELSQNYTMFWDKLEKANYFLENILSTLDEPIGSRVLDFLLANPIQDGGQWQMFVSLIEKYGVVPKAVMPETESSSSTGKMNDQITFKLRDFACAIRSGHHGHKSVDSLKKMKDGYMAEVYRMLCIHLGEPPSAFEWQWRDKDKSFHRDGRITPQEFYAKHVGIDLGDMVCLIHDPRPHHKYNELYTVRLLGNVVGGRLVEYLNVDLETMKQASIKQLQSGDSVWFGCDVGQFLDRETGVMDRELFEYDLVYGVQQTMSKAERLQYRQTQMTHAMVFTGVDLDDAGYSRKWRVENSWSDKSGDKGYFQMSDVWFDEFNFEVAVHKKFVPGDVLKALDHQPVELDPWDPMGSLA